MESGERHEKSLRRSPAVCYSLMTSPASGLVHWHSPLVQLVTNRCPKWVGCSHTSFRRKPESRKRLDPGLRRGDESGNWSQNSVELYLGNAHAMGEVRGKTAMKQLSRTSLSWYSIAVALSLLVIWISGCNEVKSASQQETPSAPSVSVTVIQVTPR